jgi:hypothetical protein
MAYTVVGKTSQTVSLDEWYKQNADLNVEYKLYEPEPKSITFNTGLDEMIKINEDGFYVRGKKVEQDDKEAETVYNAFKQWLAWANLQQ